MRPRWHKIVFGGPAKPAARPYASDANTQHAGVATGQCAEAGCDKPVAGRKLCHMHRARKKAGR